MKIIALTLAALAATALVAQERKQISVPAAKIKPMPMGKVQTGPGPEKMNGKTPEGWSMKTIDGKTITDKSMRGKVLLVDFWATWCGPCKMASPIMESLHKKYGKKGLVVIGANTSERGSDGKPLTTADAAKGYQKEHGYTYLFTYANDALKNSWGVRGIPTMFVIDKKGVVRKVQVGFDESLEKTLEAAIKPLL